MKTSSPKDLFYYSLLIFCVALPFSIALISLVGGFVFISAIISANFATIRNEFRERRLLMFVAGVYLIPVLGLFFCKDPGNGIYDLKKALPFLIFPFSFSIGPKLSRIQFKYVLQLFSGAVFLAALITFIRFQLSNNPALLDAQFVGFIHHIRFSLMILVVFIAQFYLQRMYWPEYSRIHKLLWITISTFLLFFLFWQQSLTGILTFGAVLLFLLLRFIVITKKRTQRTGGLLVLFAFLLLPLAYVGKVIYDFYDTDKIIENALTRETVRGNSYSHDLTNSFTENGHFVGLYLCEPELREAWNSQSKYNYDGVDQDGNWIKDTLIRYLTSKNLPKDAAGIASLDKQDIRNIEAGISNYKLAGRKFSLYPRLYVSIWELDHFFKTGNSNHKSIAQRMEYWEAAWMIWKEHFWFGVGTGNWKQAYYDAYKSMGSRMDEREYADAHNQYMAWLVRFGLVGMLIIVGLILWPVIQFKVYRNPCFFVFLLVLAIGNLGDSNLDTHAGAYFFLFFYGLFLMNREYLYSD
jgi:hypothetical protein